LKRAELPLLTAIFLDLVGFGMAFPDISIRLRRMLAGEGVPMGWIGFLTGLVLASLFLTQFIVSPRWGALSDRIGRKPVVAICTALSALSMLVYALTTSPWGVLVSRILAGFAAANVVVGQAYLADQTTEKERPAAMGRIGAAISVGLISGPAIGGWLAELGGSRLLGFVAASASAIGAIVLILFLPGTKPEEKVSTGRRPIFDFSLLKDTPQIKSFFWLAVLAWFALACLEGTFVPLLAVIFKYPQHLGPIAFGSERSVGGTVFGIESLIGFVVQGFFITALTKRLSTASLLRLGYAMQGIGLVLTPFAPVLGVLLFFSAIYSIGMSVAGPTVNAACSTLTPPERQGEIFGLLQGARSIGFLLGPMIGGALFDASHWAPYALAGGIGLAAAALVPKLKGSPAESSTPTTA